MPASPALPEGGFDMARARLIEAAADMKAAGEKALIALQTVYRDWDGEPEDMVPVQEAISTLRVALAKAKGDRP